jgi:hypothetical protein
LAFDGESISLYPSIGNWNFACQSHYWIRRNEVRWAAPLPGASIEAAKSRDREDAWSYWAADETLDDKVRKETEREPGESQKAGLWARLRRWVARFGHHR